MNFWLMKSEPTSYSIDDLKRDKQTSWEGVRNYQARNFMRDDMKVGDLVLFYHSNAEPPGVAGIAKVCKLAHPDKAAWNPQSKYFDEKASPHNPVWMMVDIEFVQKFPHYVSLEELKHTQELADIMVIKRGSRLSVQPVDKKHFEIVKKLGSA